MKTINIVHPKMYILFLPLLFFSFNSATDHHNNLQQKSMTIKSQINEQFFHLEVFGEGSNVEIRLNDIPVCKLKTDRTPTGYGNSSSNVKYYIIPGINTLSVYPLTNKGKTSIRLLKFSKGDDTSYENNGETLAEIEIKNDDTPVHKKITLPSNGKRWSWMDTDMITDEKSKQEAITFSKSFYKIMEQNNISEMIAAADPILTNELISKPDAQKEKIVKEWTQGLKMAFTNQDIYDDIDSISIQLIPIANGKLFEVTREDGSSLFRTSDKNEFPVEFKNIIGRKNGIWQFYR